MPKIVFITGATSGFGKACAYKFAANGYDLILNGRRTDRLQSLADELENKYNVAVLQLPFDVQIQKDVFDSINSIPENWKAIDVLVNNAGIQQWMSISDKDFFQRAKEEITINIEAPIHLTSLFLNLNSLTTIMNVTSGLSFVPLVKTPVYSATKSFFHSFTLSLKKLLQSRNIEVIELIPPALNTDLGGKGIHDTAPPVSDFIEAIFTQLKQGQTKLTFGFSEAMSKAGPEDLQKAFDRLNP